MTCERVIVRVPFRTHYIYDTYAVRFSYFSISGTENQTEPIDFFERKKKTKFFGFKSIFDFFGSVLQ